MKSTVARCAPLLIATILAGCGASPPARYYTLQPPGATQAVQAGVAPAPFMIEILPVNVPAQADQPQLMVRTGDGTVAPLYSERWSAPLPDEFRAALSDTLTRELGAPDVQVIDIQDVNDAYKKVKNEDVRFRYVIDMASLKREMEEA